MSALTGSADEQFDVVVVGAGLGGLAAAAYLAAAGRRVLLAERYTTLGGSSHVFRRQGRWEFDCGVHYLGDCGPDGIVTAMMRGLGLDQRMQWLPLDTDGFDRIVAPGFELATPVGWDAYRAALETAFPEERRAVRRFHGVMRRIGEAVDRAESMGSGAGMARWAARSGPVAPLMALPYAATLAACGLSPRATLALSVQCGALASSPLSLPTASMAAFFQDYVGGGAYYPRGGGQILAAGFAEVITSHGGVIRTNTDVERIIVCGGAVAGVKLTDGRTIAALSVVSGADAIKTYTDLVGLDKLPRLLRQRVRMWKMSAPLINGFFGVELDQTMEPNSNFFSIPNWDDAGSMLSLIRMSSATIGGRGFKSGVDWARSMAARQPMYVQSSSRRDPDQTRRLQPGTRRSRCRPSPPLIQSCGGSLATTSATVNTDTTSGISRSRR